MPKSPLINASRFEHAPVLADCVVNSIERLPFEMLSDGLIIDATLGGGGHSYLLLKKFSGLRLIGLDQDQNARNAATQKLKEFGSRVKIIDTNFAKFIPEEKAAFILADLGVSSPQLDNANRGFSFRLNGPLDMRMNQSKGITAGELIEALTESDLADLIYQFGEEKFSRRIAKRIKADLFTNGSYKGTEALAYSISCCYPPKLRYGRIHPATKTFQALRIAINQELKALEQFLKDSPNWLLKGGLLNIISFHSLEDRQVKKSFLTDERLNRITKKPIVAELKEIGTNPRSRSAKYRIAQKK